MKNKICLQYLVGLMACCMASVVFGEWRVSSEYGYDNNPHRLNDSLNPRGSDYWKNKIHYEVGKKAPFFLQSRIHYTDHIDDDRADTKTIITKAGYQNRFSGRKGDIKLSISHRLYDKTYVSRSSGEIYTFRDVQYKDRYDYIRWTPRAEFSWKLNKKNKIFLDLQYRDQNYEDFEEVGLSNLDYSHQIAKVGWASIPAKGWLTRFYISSGERKYDDRSARDLNGRKIEGLNLEQDYSEVGASLRYKVNKKTRIYAGIRYVTREDNAEGYYDYDLISGYLRFSHRFDSGSSLRGGVNWRSLDYERDNVVMEGADEDTPSSTGWKAYLQYERPAFKLADRDVYWFGQLTVYDYTADQSIYTYDRYMVSTGLRITF